MGGPNGLFIFPIGFSGFSETMGDYKRHCGGGLWKGRISDFFLHSLI